MSAKPGNLTRLGYILKIYIHAAEIAIVWNILKDSLDMELYFTYRSITDLS